MLKEELEKMLGMAPRDNYVTQKPSAITYMREGQVVPAPVEKKKVVAPTKPKTSTAPVMSSNILGEEAMKLMAPQAPARSNYVEMLPEDVAAQKKVDPVKLDQIKKQFKLPTKSAEAPKEVAPAAPEAKAPEFTPEMTQMYAKETATETPAKEPSSKEKIEGMKKKVEWADILPALIPLAVGAVMGGGTGVGTKVAGEYLLGNVADREKRNQSLEDKLLEIEKAKAKIKPEDKMLNRRFQRTAVWDDELKRSVYANYDTVTGNMFHLDGTPINSKGIEVGFAVTPEEADRRAAMAYEYKKRGIDYTPRVNPESGMPERAGGQAIFKQELPLNKVQRTEADKAAKTFTASPAFKENRTAISGAEKVLGLIKIGNVPAINSAKLTILKMAGNVGATSDRDFALIGGDPSIRGQAQTLKDKLINGKAMTDKDLAGLQKIAAFYYKKAKRDLGKSIELEDSRFSKEYKVPAGTFKNRIYPQVSEMAPAQDMVRVQNPEGKTGFMPRKKLEEKLKLGENYKVIQ